MTAQTLLGRSALPFAVGIEEVTVLFERPVVG